MQRKPPDTRIYSEITELNREFLHLLAHIDRAGQQPVFGLDPLLAKRLASLDPRLRRRLENMIKPFVELLFTQKPAFSHADATSFSYQFTSQYLPNL